MPTPLLPIPDELPLPVFTTAEALAAGVTAAQLRGPRFERLRHGLLMLRGTEPDLLDVARTLCRTDPSAVVVGPSAARLWNLPLPLSISTRPLHLVTDPRRRPTSDSVISWRRSRLPPEDIVRRPDLRLTTPSRTWADLARLLTHEDLVAIADHLVRCPRLEYDERTDPYTTLDELMELAVRCGSGRQELVSAVRDARIGADSPQETKLRLACQAAGLPEPQVNSSVPVPGGGQHQPDLLWLGYGVCAEYDGLHHRTREQFDRDIRRRERARRCGLVEVAVTSTDMRSGAHAAVHRIRAALRERGWVDPTQRVRTL